ncbi:MAG: thioredoxin [Micavibrio sp. TMED27]|nr:thioredoxin [Micavibrio sp.]OUT91485.1 MAG: thioredoxin [Micavibrio sp. TMED27]|tara:strand:+ start:701 stop:1021 length:321 start_codon:yes stop_codon:yes gene_type:complete
MSSVAVDDTQFEAEVLNSDKPVVVDFWAEWCGPCKQLSPLVDELAGEMADKVKVVKVNIEEAPEAPTKYGVRGVPTLMIFRGGEVVDTRVGGMPKSQLAEWIEGAL